MNTYKNALADKLRYATWRGTDRFLALFDDPRGPTLSACLSAADEIERAFANLVFDNIEAWKVFVDVSNEMHRRHKVAVMEARRKYETAVDPMSALADREKEERAALQNFNEMMARTWFLCWQIEHKEAALWYVVGDLEHQGGRVYVKASDAPAPD